MAEEKPKSKGEKRYGNPPKIHEKKKPAEKPEEKTEPEKAEASEQKPGDAPVKETEPEESNEGSAPEANVMAGTDGIPVQDRHMNEMADMHTRHMKEVEDMHKRHVDEHGTMHKRHHGERRSMIKRHAKEVGGTGGMSEETAEGEPEGGDDEGAEGAGE